MEDQQSTNKPAFELETHQNRTRTSIQPDPLMPYIPHTSRRTVLAGITAFVAGVLMGGSIVEFVLRHETDWPVGAILTKKYAVPYN